MNTETIDLPTRPETNDQVRILVIEDTEEDGALLEMALRRGGVNAVWERVDSADAMRRALRDEKFDLVMCDFIVPGFSAAAALEILVEQERDIPFIVVSGVVGTTDVVQVLRAGADDFVEKDDLARLVPAVERALKNAGERQARRQAEEQLRQAQKMEAVGQLTGGIAHDFNNLLSAVWGNIELVRTVIGNDPEAGKFIDATIRAVQRGSDLTHRLMAFSRKQPVSAEHTDVNRVVSGMVELMRRTLGGQIDLKNVTTPDLWATMVDPAQLENAILNLVLNARDAMPDGGGLTIKTANKNLDSDFASPNSEAGPGPFVMMAVSDTGHGMNRDVADRIFEPFFTTKETGKGTGLGLSMVFSFVKQSGGHITVDSEPDKGTTFRLYLPKSAGKVDASDPREQRKKWVGGSERILLVEDDDDVRRFVATALEKLGYEVHEAPDGIVALAMLEGDLKPDLLFSDLVLPKGMNGIAVAKEVLKKCPGAKTLLTSGYVDNALLQQIPPDMDMRVLNKPYSINDLAMNVRGALDGTPRT